MNTVVLNNLRIKKFQTVPAVPTQEAIPEVGGSTVI